MKHMMKYFCLAVLVLAVATMAGCTKDEIGDTVTFTTTVEMPGGTKALDGNGHKTFAVGDQIKVTYDDGKEAISNELTAADINSSRKSARFTFTLSSPRLTKDSPIKYEYPAAHKDLSGQDGTLATLAAKYDYAKWEGTVATEGQLPNNASLINQYAILKILLSDAYPTSHNDRYHQLIVKINNKIVAVNRTPSADTIFVAVEPVASGNIVFEAAYGKNLYKNRNTLSGKTLEAGHLYPIKVVMNEVKGTLSGPFLVDPSGTIVHFSKGNLQAYFNTSGATPEWQIAKNQYTFVGNNNPNTQINGTGSADANNAVDLFGWSTDANGYYGIDSNTNNSRYNGTFVDWGDITVINYDGADTKDEYIRDDWFTLDSLQWRYLISHHTYGEAIVHGTQGFVILPDYWKLPDGCSFTDFAHGGYTSNNYTNDQWELMEAAGAVFLPAAGKRNGRDVNEAGTHGYYWSSSAPATSTTSAYCFFFYNNVMGNNIWPGTERHFGYSVRLVR